MNNQDDRKFTDVLQSIGNAEKDVDKVLDAARLERRQGSSTRLSADQKFNLLLAFMMLAFLLALFLVAIVLG